MGTGSIDERSAMLVIEIEVADLARSVAFYRGLGFTVVRAEGGFASLAWRGAWLFLTVGPRASGNGATGTNLRVLVDDVDAAWEAARASGAAVEAPIADRSYGMRDFTIRDPDGFALRFAAPIVR
jgi:catechol 2,3-dioxygenase-like lactoylglutathione lyase family enzyme